MPGRAALRLSGDEGDDAGAGAAPTVEDERYDLAQTNAINALLIKNGSPRFGSVHEVRRIVAHARKGGILSMGGSFWRSPQRCAIFRACPSGMA